MTNTPAVLSSVSDAVMTISLNRPDRLNAMSGEMSFALAAALRAAQENEAVRVVVLSGVGRGFCAGQDLSEPVVSPDVGEVDLGRILEQSYIPVIEQIAAMRVPVIARVAGVAAGAGASLALACDLVVAGQSAFFLQSFNKIGLLPDAGATFFVPQLLGSAKAMGLALLGEKLSASKAAEMGLIWACVPDEELDTKIAAITAQIAQSPPLSMTEIKRAIRSAHSRDLAQALRYERDVQKKLGQSQDYAEGVRAFIEKRKPIFSGR